MQRLSNIVVGISLSPGSDEVLRTVAALARTSGASVWLIHAYAHLFLVPGSGVDFSWAGEQIKNLRRLIEKQARRTGLASLAQYSPERIALELGSAHREIVDLAQRVQADLVVLGAPQHRNRLGSTTDRVIRQAACPVLSVRSSAAFPPARVAVPVDLSASSAKALSQGLSLLAQIGLSPTEAEALFVHEACDVNGFGSEQHRRSAAERLHQFLEDVPEGLRPAQQLIRLGEAREQILAALADSETDLAVLGTRGHGGLDSLAIGSVATEMLRSASCNLLLVPPRAVLPEALSGKALDRRVLPFSVDEASSRGFSE